MVGGIIGLVGFRSLFAGVEETLLGTYARFLLTMEYLGVF
jgi:hypothetical protein